ncbi:MBL fold metallo-hydrolase [Acuticoccus yangtzensis]|uniref:MBL fold metallo-hydrolase n=1 Tax=Acuticoccus yangtzensis TaxID=1443441 RepID=UPI0009499F65|nr:MBL fold metallo-hydrolase [Acuticoccus yangtzensis]
MPTDAQTTAPLQQSPGFHRIAVGGWTVTALADGGMGMGPGLVPDVAEADFTGILRANFLPTDRYPGSVNTYLLQRGGRTILVDAGGTPSMGPLIGRMPQVMEAAGVTPGDVDTILITHLHRDHIGALTLPSGEARFPRATLKVADAELAFWTGSSDVPDSRRETVDLITASIAAYEGRMSPITADGPVEEGVAAVSLPGHTPGHTGFRVTDGEAELLIWGDIVHIGPVQLAFPDAQVLFDIDGAQAVATRRKILAEVAGAGTLVAGMHLPFPGIGHIAAEGAAYRFVPIAWDHAFPVG